MALTGQTFCKLRFRWLEASHGPGVFEEMIKQASGSAAGADLQPECLRQILRSLQPVDLARAGCVCKHWHTSAGDELLWEVHARQLYYVEGLMGPDQELCANWREVFRAWHTAYAKHGVEGAKVLKAWFAIKAWLRVHHPDLLGTLRPGASEAAIAEAEQRLGTTLPPGMAAIHRLHDGQYETKHPAWGLFGGYQFYNYLTMSYMLSLAELKVTALPGNPGAPSQLVAVSFASSRKPMRKTVYAMVADGLILNNWSANLWVGQDASLVDWFARFAERLQSGYYRADKLTPHSSVPTSPDALAFRGISLYPRRPPDYVTAVTRGVSISASAACVVDEHQLLFSYSIRMSLASQEEQRGQWPADVPFKPLSSVQLVSRHWLVMNNDGDVVDEVRGAAVIGERPILLAGGEEFVYQSASHEKGFMEGFFEMVEGTIASPTGPPFPVTIPRFKLEMPDHLY